MVKRSVAKKIIKSYYSAKFPGAFGNLPAFRDALKRQLDIDIGLKALRRLLKTASLHYQVNVSLGKHFKTRPFYSGGSFIQAFSDPIFVPLEPGTMQHGTKTFIFLAVLDSHSRFLYTTKLEKVSPDHLRRAFTKKGMPKFPIIRTDRDLSLQALAHTYFA